MPRLLFYLNVDGQAKEVNAWENEYADIRRARKILSAMSIAFILCFVGPFFVIFKPTRHLYPFFTFVRAFILIGPRHFAYS